MFWLLVFIALAAAYWLLMQPYKYWVNKKVKQGNPVVIFGDFWGLPLRKQSQAEMIQMLYNITTTGSYCGIYQFQTPTLLLKDPELIKEVTVKHFDHFSDHRTIIPGDIDPLFGNNLFFLAGQKWRNMRTTLSPAFTSSKMKSLFSLISMNGERFVQYFLNQNDDFISLEMKDVFTRFANDVIAETAFGIECDSLDQPKNTFYLMGLKTTDFSGIWSNLKLFGYFFVPQVCKLLKLTLFSEEVGSFFHNLIKENINSREKHGIVRQDMVNLLLEARKQESAESQITDTDITSQALIFFFGGFDSVSSLMCFMSHELAVNPEVQNKLRKEVDETLEECGGELTYEAIISMKYMDMVVSETLRKWPNVPAVDRICTKPYKIIPKTLDEKPVELQINDVVMIPIYGLHRDPEYFPDPDRFDPERFNEKNKENIQPYTYLPFGAGPRNCIGSKFAVLQTKVMFFHLLAHFEIVAVEKTQIPLRLARNTFVMIGEKRFWLGLKRRN